jgi:hypothetical protein
MLPLQLRDGQWATKQITLVLPVRISELESDWCSTIWTVLKTWSIGGISDSIGLDGFGAKACGGSQAFSISMIG